MKKMKRNVIFRVLIMSGICLALSLFIICPQTAQAIPTLKLDDGVHAPIIVVDGAANDEIGEAGKVGYGGILGVFDIDITAIGTLLGSSSSPRIILSSGVVSSSGVGTLNIWFSETGFGDTTGGFTTTVGGTATDPVSFRSYMDAADTLFGTSTTLGFINSINGTDHSTTATFLQPYSLTSLATISSDAGGTVTSFTMNVSVPETSSMVLLGICLIGILILSKKFLNNTENNMLQKLYS